jgi:cell division protein YceG involved in septum cleavage
MQMPGVTYPIDFSIHRGTALKTASEELHRGGVLSHPWAFVLLARLKGQAGEIKAGSYVTGAGCNTA